MCKRHEQALEAVELCLRLLKARFGARRVILSLVMMMKGVEIDRHATIN